MHYSNLVYRPPWEARSLLLQVTNGCSHNSCSFCTMYKDEPFYREPIEQIEEDLLEAKPYERNFNRVFLVNGDAFTLETEELAEIAGKIHEILPFVRTISGYASINNILKKTDAELVTLRRLGFNTFNIGVESGLDSALLYMNKGYTSAQAEEAMLRMNAAGYQSYLNVIFGIAGSGHGLENAKATASFLNKVQPSMIFTGTIHAEEGCKLYDDMKSGAFTESTVGEYLEEEESFLRQLKLTDCYYFGLHPANVIPLQGRLPMDRDSLIDRLIQARSEMSEDKLSSRLRRSGSEGAVI